MMLGGIVAGLCLVAILIYGLACFDKVTAFEQAHHSDEWAADGFPDGFFCHSNGLFGEWGSRRACAMTWLFLTPDWARQPNEARVWLRRFRLCALIWNVGILTLVWTGGRFAATKPSVSMPKADGVETPSPRQAYSPPGLPRRLR